MKWPHGERFTLPFGIDPLAVLCATLACAVATIVQSATGSEWDGNWAGLASLPIWIATVLWVRRVWRLRSKGGE